MSITVQSSLDKLADLQAYLKVLEPDINISSDTDVGARLQSLAEALGAMDVNASAIEDNIFPQDCDSASLEKHAEARLGTSPRLAATVASGIITVSGTVGSSVYTGDTLTHSSGSTYQLTADLTLSATTGTVAVESITTGIDANLSVSETLTFDAPRAGITSTATVSTAISGGEDAESDDELRERLLNAWANPLAGGRASDYWLWAMSVASVGSAYVYCPSSYDPTGRQGLGTVDVAILKDGTGSARVPSATIQDDVEVAIAAARPTCVSTVTVLIPDAVTQAVTVQVEAESSAYDYDWTGTMEVDTWESGSKKITMHAELPETLQTYFAANSSARLYLNGEVLTVVTIESGATPMWVTVEETPASTPTHGNTVYPGGPLSQPILDAITSLFDSLGPAKGTAYDREQVGWEDTLWISSIYEAVCGVTGVRRCTVTLPASNVTPTDHAGGTVDFLIPGTITITPA